MWNFGGSKCHLVGYLLSLTLRRCVRHKDMAKLIWFLSSDLASYITGTMIDVSGGKFATQMPWLAHREP